MFPQERAFWDFIIEREKIRLRRFDGLPRDQWTSDEIMKNYSFTNVKRHHDRTTMLLNQEFYGTRDLPHPSRTALLNAAIFRYHGTIESARAIGWTQDFDRDKLVKKNELRMACGETVFTSAYIVPNCGSSAPKHEIVATIIQNIDEISGKILDTDSWATACDRLTDLWGVGSFMAKEVLLDYILATEWVPYDWETWTPVGPGGRRGAGAVKYGIVKSIEEWEALAVIREVYSNRKDCWIHDVELDLTDIQFQFCEFAKYEKARMGLGRPKRRFHPTQDDVTQGRTVIRGK